MSWPTRIVRIFAVISLLSSFFVIAICGWTLGSILYSSQFDRPTLNSNSELSPTPALYTSRVYNQQIEDTSIKNVSTHDDTSKEENPGTEKTTQKTLIVEPENETTMKSFNNEQNGNFTPSAFPVDDGKHYWIILTKKYTSTFKGMMEAFTWIGIITGVIQAGSVFLILCSSPKKLFTFSKFTIGLHFICLIILLVSFFTPLVHKGFCDDFVGSGQGIQGNCSMRMMKMSEFSKKLQTDIKELPRNPMEYLRKNFHAYYTFIGLDSCVIFMCIIIFCCLLRFDDQYAFI